MRLTNFAVYGLFGIFNHEVKLHLDERVTIIHGPNGYGKTSLLRLVHSLCDGSLQEIRRIPFQTFVMGFDDGRRLEIERTEQLEGALVCRLRLMSGTHILASADVRLGAVSQKDRAQIERHFPYFMMIGEDIWEDRNDGEIATTEDLMERFGMPVSKVAKIEWFTNLVAFLNVKMIETSRLNRDPSQENVRRRVQTGPRDTAHAVQRYAADLAARIQSTLTSYAERAQRLDQSFPIRLLSANSFPLSPFSGEQLRGRIQNLEEKRTRLKDAGLLERDERQEVIPTNIDDSVQGVLSMYIADVEEKLSAFNEILTKIELLQQIVDSHFSFKHLRVTKEEGFVVHTDKGDPLNVGRLSSGEQHLLVLIYELLFTDRPDSLVLIDEPEISLHVEWQLAFLSDLQKIAKVASQDVLIATHSPQIVNDRIDLLIPFEAPLGTSK